MAASSFVHSPLRTRQCYQNVDRAHCARVSYHLGCATSAPVRASNGVAGTGSQLPSSYSVRPRDLPVKGAADPGRHGPRWGRGGLGAVNRGRGRGCVPDSGQIGDGDGGTSGCTAGVLRHGAGGRPATNSFVASFGSFQWVEADEYDAAQLVDCLLPHRALICDQVRFEPSQGVPLCDPKNLLGPMTQRLGLPLTGMIQPNVISP